MTDVEAIERVMTLLAEEWEANRWAVVKTRNDDTKWLFRGFAENNELTFRSLANLRYKYGNGTGPFPGQVGISEWCEYLTKEALT